MEETSDENCNGEDAHNDANLSNFVSDCLRSSCGPERVENRSEEEEEAGQDGASKGSEKPTQVQLAFLSSTRSRQQLTERNRSS